MLRHRRLSPEGYLSSGTNSNSAYPELAIAFAPVGPSPFTNRQTVVWVCKIGVVGCPATGMIGPNEANGARRDAGTSAGRRFEKDQVSTFPFRMPKDLEVAITAQAERAGVSLNQYLLAIVTTHAGAQAEAERTFAARAARSSPARALDILTHAGQGQPPEPGDARPSDLAP